MRTSREKRTRLSSSEIIALATGMKRHLSWGLPLVALEVRRWRRLASSIRDPTLRATALSAMRRKRPQTDGAALFTILPRRRSRALLRFLVAYQLLWDCYDSIDERAALLGDPAHVHLHSAFLEALDPSRPISRHVRDYDDAGYLHGLVAACRQSCSELAGYPRVRHLVLEQARRFDVLPINHEPDRPHRERMMRAWADREHGVPDANWFELTGGASAAMNVFALLALACDESCPDAELRLLPRAYFPWPGALATMLDSYVDRLEDEATGMHVYLSYYDSHEAAVRRMCEIIERTLSGMRELRAPERHRIVMAGMIAMYLSKESAWAPPLREHTEPLVEAGGALTRALMPVLRTWRRAYRLTSS